MSIIQGHTTYLRYLETHCERFDAAVMPHSCLHVVDKTRAQL